MTNYWIKSISSRLLGVVDTVGNENFYPLIYTETIFEFNLEMFLTSVMSPTSIEVVIFL